MATYKVIQDIEAEDKIVGPLTLRQLIYAGVAAICGYLSFIALSKGATFLLTFFLPIMLFTGFFAFPWGRDQPTEVWALAKIRFFLKPRRRIWDQTGASDLVHVTAPKHIEKTYTNQLSQTEVHSRLSALANTLDSRGWAVKDINTNLTGPNDTAVILPSSDRLVDPSSMPQEVDPIDIRAADDMLDEVNNPRAQQLKEMMTASSKSRREKLVNQMREPDSLPAPAILPRPQPKSSPAAAKTTPAQQPAAADYWFLQKPLDMPQTGSGPADNAASPAGSDDDDTTAAPDVPAANPTPDEAALAEELKANRERTQQSPYYQHMKIIQPLDAQAAAARRQASQLPSVTPPLDAATMELANNNDLNITTIARIANKQDEHPDEVVISLHSRRTS
jgi:hypothetical protein